MTIVQIAEGAFSVPSYSEVTIVPAFTLILGEPHDDDCEEGLDDPE
jgi:hypothetical protein